MQSPVSYDTLSSHLLALLHTNEDRITLWFLYPTRDISSRIYLLYQSVVPTHTIWHKFLNSYSNSFNFDLLPYFISHQIIMNRELVKLRMIKFKNESEFAPWGSKRWWRYALCIFTKSTKHFLVAFRHLHFSTKIIIFYELVIHSIYIIASRRV